MIRNNLAKLMIDRNISATQLYNDTGIARSTISKISNNNTDKISLKTVDKICNYLEVSHDDFFEMWPYEVVVKSGFENFDSVEEARNSYVVATQTVPAFLLIELSRGKNVKHLIEYNVEYAEDYDPGYPFDDGYMPFIKNISLSENSSNSIIVEDMPIQFKNDLIKEVENNLIETFNVGPHQKIILELEKFIFVV